MSLTCQHSIADAPNHPECQGCRAIPRRESRAAQEWDAMSDDERRRAFAAMGAASSGRPDPRPRPDHLHWYHADRLIFDDPWCPSLLLDRPLTPDEDVARSEDPRPGVWAGEEPSDLRGLTQEQTDVLIRFELINFASHPDERDDVLAVVGSHPRSARILGQGAIAQAQRGGIDSDPMVRLLAFRAWGDRYRRWAELRGVLAGETVHIVELRTPVAPVDVLYPLVSRRQAGETQTGMAMSDAEPGQLVVVDTVFGDVTCRVSDRLRAGDLQVDHVGDLMAMVDFARRPRIEELTVRLGLAAEPVFEPGARAPGVKPSPPVPPWARKRRDDR
jgi:hypothetical protein